MKMQIHLILLGTVVLLASAEETTQPGWQPRSTVGWQPRTSDDDPPATLPYVPINETSNDEEAQVGDTSAKATQTYKAVSCKFSGSIDERYFYTIKSRSFPNIYPNNAWCRYTFQNRLYPQGGNVKASCNIMEVRDDCSKDYIAMYINGAYINRKLCKGQKWQIVQVKGGETVDFLFRSNSNGNMARGMRCSVWITPKDTTTGGSTSGSTSGTGSTNICNVCGKDTGNRIVGGSIQEKGSIPYQVALETTSGFRFCGGTLVGKRTVITAAHCNDGSTVNVRLGAHRYSGVDGRVIRAASFRNHPNYNSRTMANDIAIITLVSDAPFNDDIMPACLPKYSSGKQVGAAAKISGWGTTSEGGSPPSALKAAVVRVQGSSICSSAYSNYNNNQMLCASRSGIDSCQGDSGGPIAVNWNTRAVNIGVTSFGYGCARQNYPGVYARTSNYKSWIEQNARSNDYCFVSV